MSGEQVESSPIMIEYSVEYMEELRNSPDMKAFKEYLEKMKEEQSRRQCGPSIIIEEEKKDDDKEEEGRKSKTYWLGPKKVMKRTLKQEAKEHIKKYGRPDETSAEAIVRGLLMKDRAAYRP